MSEITEQIAYYRGFTHDFVIQILQNIAYYREIVTGQIKQGFDWAISLYTSGWLKAQALWLLHQFIQGFKYGYNLVLQCLDMLIAVKNAIINFIIKFPKLLVELSKGIYHAFIDLLIHGYKLVLHCLDMLIAVKNAIINFIIKFPKLLIEITKGIYHAFIDLLILSKELLILIKDTAMTMLKNIGTFISKVVEKALDKLASTLGVVFGISSAMVDLSFDLLDFLYKNTLGQFLPSLSSIPFAAIALPYIKGALAVGLVAGAAYGVYVGCKKLYPHVKELIKRDGLSLLTLAAFIAIVIPLVLLSRGDAQPASLSALYDAIESVFNGIGNLTYNLFLQVSNIFHRIGEFFGLTKPNGLQANQRTLVNPPPSKVRSNNHAPAITPLREQRQKRIQQENQQARKEKAHARSRKTASRAYK
ncbi:MAG: hypothetical protein AB7V32_09250 [Candidatus Berkiella sp.]